MSDVVFVDTNILVYARDASEGAKQRAAAAWMKRLWQDRRGRISIQVLQEYYVVVTRKLKPGLPATTAQADLRYLMTWDPVVTDIGLLESAWALERQYDLSFWNATVVAAAQRVNAGYLLSEDMQHGHTIGSVRITNPFITAVTDL